MILEYRDDGFVTVWHMIDADHIAKCRFRVEDDMKKLSEAKADDTNTVGNYKDIRKMLKEKMNRAGYAPHFNTDLHIGNKEKLTDIKEIVMIVVSGSRHTEIHFFDADFPFRISYKDGTIYQESMYFKH